MESNADVTVYTDKGAWEAAVAALESETLTCNDGETEDIEVQSDFLDAYGLPYGSPLWDRVLHEEYTNGDPGGDFMTTFTVPADTYAFGGNWDLAVPDTPGDSIEVCFDRDDAAVDCIDIIPSSYNGEFWGLVCDTPFAKVVLRTPNPDLVVRPDAASECQNEEDCNRETYELDDMVIAGCEEVPPVPPCDPLVEFKALINIDRTEDDHDRARFQMLGAAGAPYGKCTEDFNLTLTAPDGTEVFNAAAHRDAGADVHCHCNKKENCFVTVRATDIDQNLIDPYVDGSLTATFTVGLSTADTADDKCYASTDDWRQQDSGSTTDTDESQWTKFRTP
jgi:hypothetical protein